MYIIIDDFEKQNVKLPQQEFAQKIRQLAYEVDLDRKEAIQVRKAARQITKITQQAKEKARQATEEARLAKEKVRQAKTKSLGLVNSSGKAQENNI